MNDCSKCKERYAVLNIVEENKEISICLKCYKELHQKDNPSIEGELSQVKIENIKDFIDSIPTNFNPDDSREIKFNKEELKTLPLEIVQIENKLEKIKAKKIVAIMSLDYEEAKKWGSMQNQLIKQIESILLKYK